MISVSSGQRFVAPLFLRDFFQKIVRNHIYSLTKANNEDAFRRAFIIPCCFM